MNTTWHGVITVLRLASALLFCDAGWMKMQSPQAFADSIATFHLLPPWLNNPIALGLPPFELIVGILLFCGWKLRLAALCGLAACVVFQFSLVWGIARGLPVDCGCFGETHPALTRGPRLWLAAGRDALLAGVFLIVYLRERRRT